MNLSIQQVVTVFGLNVAMILLAGVILRLLRIKQFSLGDICALSVIFTVLDVLLPASLATIAIGTLVSTVLYHVARWYIDRPMPEKDSSK